MRIFHILSDGKTVKEISLDTFNKLPDFKRKNRIFLYVWNSEIAVCNHNHFAFIGKRLQVEAVLKKCWGNGK